MRAPGLRALGPYFPPGSVPWLMAHELRLVFRSSKWVRNKFVPWILAALFIAIAVMSGVPLAHAHPGPVQLTPALSAAILTGSLFLFAISVSQALTMTIQLFFERGDFDLLFSSPISPARVLSVRLLTIAFSPFLYFSAFLSCLLLPTMVLDDPRLFGAYGLLAFLCLMSALVAICLAMGLYRWLGPRRTRVAGHLLAVLLALIFIAGAQLPQYFDANPLSDVERGALHVHLARWFGPGSLLDWPGQAVLANPQALVPMLVFAVLAFWLLTSRLGHSFAVMLATAQGRDAPARKRALSRPLKGFSASPLWAMVFKEWRQLKRDPMLLSQVLLQGVLVVPMVFGFYFGTSAAHPTGYSPDQAKMFTMITLSASLVFVTAMVAGALVEIIVMGEDAPDLLASAPMSGDKVRFAKLFSALFPVGTLALLLSAGLIYENIWVGFITVVMCVLACYSVCYITFWFEKPQPQKNFRRKQVDGTVITRLSKLFLCFCFLPVSALAVLHSIWTLVAALLPVAFLGILYACRRYDV